MLYPILSLSFEHLPMLDYVKLILMKVSFNRALFEKELRKALKLLSPAEVPDFRSWCYQQFARIYRTVLKRVFGNASQGDFSVAGVG